jgi:uncharacterized protein with gpF-like domain
VVAAIRGTQREVTPVLIIDSIYDLALWMERMRETFPPLLVQALRGGYANGAALASYSGTIDLTRPTVARVLEALLDTQLEINVTTRNRLASSLQAGLDARETIPQIVERVQAEIADMKVGRARMIARTAATSAFGAGQNAAFSDAGAVAKEWLSQRDGKVRPTHVEADGQRVPIADTFTVGGTQMAHPGDVNASVDETVRCRCSMLPVIE